MHEPPNIFHCVTFIVSYRHVPHYIVCYFISYRVMFYVAGKSKGPSGFETSSCIMAVRVKMLNFTSQQFGDKAKHQALGTAPTSVAVG